jgi:hypothetical protein
MWKPAQQPAQQMVLSFIAIAGLLSGLACQSHMVAEGSTPSHHATHEHEASGSHHATQHGGATHSRSGTHHHEGSAPEDPCCVIQLADAKTLNLIVVLPEAVTVPFTSIVEESALRLPDASQALTHKPPGNCSLLHQTCVLLI